jgi:hypothetical protein
MPAQLTSSVEQGLSWEADSSTTGHSLCILWDWKVHDYVYHSLPIVRILNQISPVHADANFDSIKVSGFGLYEYLYWVDLDNRIILMTQKCL